MHAVLSWLLVTGDSNSSRACACEPHGVVPGRMYLEHMGASCHKRPTVMDVCNQCCCRDHHIIQQSTQIDCVGYSAPHAPYRHTVRAEQVQQPATGYCSLFGGCCCCCCMSCSARILHTVLCRRLTTTASEPYQLGPAASIVAARYGTACHNLANRQLHCCQAACC